MSAPSDAPWNSPLLTSTAAAKRRKGVLERVDHQFGDDKTEANRCVCGHEAVVARDGKRKAPVIGDHRGSKALAQMREIGAQWNRAQTLDLQVLLHDRDREHATVCVAQMPAGLL